MNIFGAVRRTALRICAVVLALTSAPTIWICAGQLERDRFYRDELHAAAAQIDAKRRELGHQPAPEEVPEIGELLTYYRLVDWPTRLRSLGARSKNDYMLSVRRSEWADYYHSWNGKDTCDSKAWIPLLVVGVPLAAASVLLLMLSRSKQRRSSADR